MAITTPDWVAIGRTLRARGNRGELSALLDSSDPERGSKLQRIRLQSPSSVQEFDVEDFWLHDGRPILKLRGVDSISDAERWQNCEIQVRREEVSLPGGEFSHADLVGCRVLAGDAEIGVVDHIEEYGGPQLLAVARPSGGEALIPFAKSICKEIDIAAKVIRVELPEGLLDLD